MRRFMADDVNAEASSAAVRLLRREEAPFYPRSGSLQFPQRNERRTELDPSGYGQIAEDPFIGGQTHLRDLRASGLYQTGGERRLDYDAIWPRCLGCEDVAL